MKRIIFTALLCLTCETVVFGALKSRGLHPEILVNDSIDAGIALITWRGDTIVAGKEDRFELASVCKFHQAAALSHVMPFDSLLNKSITIDAVDLPGGTWSPMRAAFRELPTTVTPVELLDYSLNVSDNNACDIIWKNFISPQAADSILRSHKLAENFSLAVTEAEMHAAPSTSMQNSSTPLDAAKFIYRFFTADTTASATLVKAVMSKESPFGSERIRAGIPRGNAAVFHKTGTGFDLAGDSVSVINDLAFVSYPTAAGYGCYALAVFVRNAPSKRAAEDFIAGVSHKVWQAIVVDESVVMNNNTSAPCGRNIRPDNGVRAEDYSPFTELLTEAVLDIVLSRILD